MDNQELVVYQEALEVALVYQRRLEETREEQRQRIAQLEDDGQAQEERINQLATEIVNQSNTILALQAKNNKLMSENRRYKRAYQELEEGCERLGERFNVLQRTTEEQAEQIARFKAMIAIQQKLLRKQREPPSQDPPCPLCQ